MSGLFQVIYHKRRILTGEIHICQLLCTQKSLHLPSHLSQHFHHIPKNIHEQTKSEIQIFFNTYVHCDNCLTFLLNRCIVTIILSTQTKINIHVCMSSLQRTSCSIMDWCKSLFEEMCHVYYSYSYSQNNLLCHILTQYCVLSSHNPHLSLKKSLKNKIWIIKS